MSRFEGKVVVVTGGASGIGASAVDRFASEGAAVAVADINRDAAEAFADRIRSRGGRALASAADVSNEAAVSQLIDTTVRELGGLDVVVNNAGIGEPPDPIEEKSEAAWQKVIGINLTGVFFGVKHAARAMKAAGTRGVIVNVASILGHVGFNGAPAYTAAKHGVLGLTKAAALELAPTGIRVVAVAPAFIRTPLIEGLEDAVLPLHPVGRLGSVEEVAALILFLASDEAAYLTGASYLVDGGYTSQ